MNGETRFDQLMKLKEKIEEYQSEIKELKRFSDNLNANGAEAISYSRGIYVGDYAKDIIKSYVPKIRESVEERIQYLEALIHNTKKMF